MFYVIMTDEFMSGWGMSAGKTNKMIVQCPTLQDAQLIEKNAKKRSEMKNVCVKTEIPYYNKDLYLLSVKDFSELSGMWKE